ncbi:stanniocalcin 1, like [Trichomycterus rosablanca]|uniref:stanniocalcin 1, like n=1 Tax=Trichomycterus rosablanca TaxID=2290929 RepID=UPI002F3558AA
MLLKIGFILCLVSALSAIETEPYVSAVKRSGFSANSPSDVVRCLNSGPQVGCSAFSCLENSMCDTNGLQDICNIFFNTAALFNTEGKTFFKESIKCIANGITSKVLQTIRHCGTFQTMITEVQEECYKKHNICGVVRSNSDAIGEVIQVPRHFPNRFYSTLLQSLTECDEETVEVVRSGLMARLGPDMLTLFQLLQKKQCPQDLDHGSSEMDGHDGFRWPLEVPMFRIQPNLHNREPNHLFAKKR